MCLIDIFHNSMNVHTYVNIFENSPLVIQLISASILLDKKNLWNSSFYLVWNCAILILSMVTTSTKLLFLRRHIFDRFLAFSKNSIRIKKSLKILKNNVYVQFRKFRVFV